VNVTGIELGATIVVITVAVTVLCDKASDPPQDIDTRVGSADTDNVVTLGSTIGTGANANAAALDVTPSAVAVTFAVSGVPSVTVILATPLSSVFTVAADNTASPTTLNDTGTPDTDLHESTNVAVTVYESCPFASTVAPDAGLVANVSDGTDGVTVPRRVTDTGADPLTLPTDACTDAEEVPVGFSDDASTPSVTCTVPSEPVVNMPDGTVNGASAVNVTV